MNQPQLKPDHRIKSYEVVNADNPFTAGGAALNLALWPVVLHSDAGVCVLGILVYVSIFIKIKFVCLSFKES